MSTLTYIDPFTAKGEAKAIEHLQATSRRIRIPPGHRNIYKLLQMAPLIMPEKGLRLLENQDRFQFDLAILPSSNPGDRRARDNTTIICAFEKGIILKAIVSPNSSNVFPASNIYIMKEDDMEKLVLEYENALNKCDSMLILFYAALMYNESRYEEFISLLQKTFKVRSDVIKQILLSIPQTFLIHGLNQVKKFDANLHRVAANMYLGWLSEVNVGKFYIMIPIDHIPTEYDTSSFNILSDKARSYTNSDILIDYIVSINLPVFIQAYRLGRVMMNKERSKQALEYIRKTEYDKLIKLNYEELFLMGGVFEPEDIDEEIQRLWNYWSGNFERDDVNPDDLCVRVSYIFCFMATSSNVAHCFIDINDREPGPDVMGKVIIFAKRMLAREDKGLIASFVFYLADFLMGNRLLRISATTEKSFYESFIFLQIDTSKPKKSIHLNIIQKIHNLSLTYHRSQVFIQDKNLTRDNEPDSVVLMTEEESRYDITRHDTSIYLIYNSSGNIQSRKKVTTSENSFLNLHKRLLGNDNSEEIREIRKIFTQDAIKLLRIKPRVGVRKYFVNNLTGQALKRFLALEMSETPKTKEISEQKDLFGSLEIDLLHSEEIEFNETNMSRYMLLTEEQIKSITTIITKLIDNDEKIEELEDYLSNNVTQTGLLAEELKSLVSLRFSLIKSILIIPSAFIPASISLIRRKLSESKALSKEYNATLELENSESVKESNEPQTYTSERNRRSGRFSGRSRRRKNRREVLQESSDDEPLDDESLTRTNEDPVRESFNESSADKQSNENPKVKKSEEIFAKLLEVQKYLTDLFYFATEFENCLIRLIDIHLHFKGRGIYLKGPINEFKKEKEEIEVPLEEKIYSYEEILKAYKIPNIRDKVLEDEDDDFPIDKIPVINYGLDFSRYQRIVPGTDFIRARLPTFFSLQGLKPSMVFTTQEGAKATFPIGLQEKEIILMAQLEVKKKHTQEFRDLIAVLYQLRNETYNKEEKEVRMALFLRMISTASYNAIQEAKRKREQES
jgi:hypothetical protein